MEISDTGKENEDEVLLRKRYVVVIRAGSRLRFEPGEQFAINVNVSHNKGILTFRTRYSDEGFEDQVPREMWVDARGEAKSLVEAIEVFTNIANTLTTIISFCMNGYAGECQFHLGYEDTPNAKQREFFEQFVHDEKGLPLPSRLVNAELILSIIETLDSHPFKDRLLNAIGQYVLSLEYWRRGSETLSTAHLFMGMESLVQVAKEIEINKSGLTTAKELAEAWQIELKELDSKIRRDILFRGDQETHRNAKKASDGMEHGFLSFTEIRPLAETVRDRTATYLREAIIKLIKLPEEVENKLLSRPYDRPIGTIGYIRYLRGELNAEHDRLASQGQMYPIIEWKFSVNSFSLSDQKLRISFKQSLTPRIGEGVSFSPKSIEIYGPDGFVSESNVPQNLEPEIIHNSENTKRDELIRSVEKVWKAVSAYGTNSFIEGSVVEIFILALFTRCKDKFHSVITLIKHGLPTESLILARSLWIDVLYLSQIAHSEPKAALVFGLERENLKKDRTRLQYILRSSPTKEVLENIESNKKLFRFLLDAKRKLNVQKLQTPEPYLVTASTICSPESYQVLIDSERFISDSLLLDINIKPEKNNNKLLIESHSFSYDKAVLISGFATEAILLTCKSVALIYGWDELTGIEEYAQKSKEWLKT